MKLSMENGSKFIKNWDLGSTRSMCRPSCLRARVTPRLVCVWACACYIACVAQAVYGHVSRPGACACVRVRFTSLSKPPVAGHNDWFGLLGGLVPPQGTPQEAKKEPKYTKKPKRSLFQNHQFRLGKSIFWCHFVYFWGHFRTVGPFLINFGVILVTFEAILGQFRCHLGSILDHFGSLWAILTNFHDFMTISTPWWVHFRAILEPCWAQFLCIFGICSKAPFSTRFSDMLASIVGVFLEFFGCRNTIEKRTAILWKSCFSLRKIDVFKGCAIDSPDQNRTKTDNFRTLFMNTLFHRCEVDFQPIFGWFLSFGVILCIFEVILGPLGHSRSILVSFWSLLRSF